MASTIHSPESTTKRRMSLDDTAVPPPSKAMFVGVIRRLHAFRKETLEARSADEVLAFVYNRPTFLEGVPTCFLLSEVERVVPKVSARNGPVDIWNHMVDQALSTRFKTAVAFLNSHPEHRNAVVYEIPMNSMKGDLGELYTNHDITLRGKIPPEWIAEAVVCVPDYSPEECRSFPINLTGSSVMARHVLVRTDRTPCLEVAHTIQELRAVDVLHVPGDAHAIYEFLKDLNAKPPSFVQDVVFGSRSRISVQKTSFPKYYVVWALEDLCEDLETGANPCADTTLAFVIHSIDILSRRGIIPDRVHYTSMVMAAIHEGLQCGLESNMSFTDKTIFSRSDMRQSASWKKRARPPSFLRHNQSEMATFKTTVKDGVSLPFVYQSAQSKTTDPLVTLEFRNRDEDAQQVYQMASVNVLDSKANALQNRFGTISFATSSNGFLTEAVRITDQNFVGINNSNPVSELDVKGDSTFTGNLSISNGKVSLSGDLEMTGGSLTVDGSALSETISYDSNLGQLTLIAAGESQVFITSTGLVGIGTSNPTEKLTVNGNVFATGSVIDGIRGDLGAYVDALSNGVLTGDAIGDSNILSRHHAPNSILDIHISDQLSVSVGGTGVSNIEATRIPVGNDTGSIQTFADLTFHESTLNTSNVVTTGSLGVGTAIVPDSKAHIGGSIRVDDKLRIGGINIPDGLENQVISVVNASNLQYIYPHTDLFESPIVAAVSQPVTEETNTNVLDTLQIIPQFERMLLHETSRFFPSDSNSLTITQNPDDRVLILYEFFSSRTDNVDQTVRARANLSVSGQIGTDAYTAHKVNNVNNDLHTSIVGGFLQPSSEETLSYDFIRQFDAGSGLVSWGKESTSIVYKWPTGNDVYHGQSLGLAQSLTTGLDTANISNVFVTDPGTFSSSASGFTMASEATVLVFGSCTTGTANDKTRHNLEVNGSPANSMDYYSPESPQFATTSFFQILSLSTSDAVRVTHATYGSYSGSVSGVSLSAAVVPPDSSAQVNYTLQSRLVSRWRTTHSKKLHGTGPASLGPGTRSGPRH